MPGAPGHARGGGGGPKARSAALALTVALGVLAAFLYAAAAACQQRAAHGAAAAQVSGEGRRAQRRGAERGTSETGVGSRHEARSARLYRVLPVITLMGGLAVNRLWLLGWVTNFVGFVTQAAALHLGSVAVVQPLLVTQLLFAMLLGAALGGPAPLNRDWLGVFCVTGGLVVLLAVPGAAPLSGEPHRPDVLLAVAASAGLVLLLVALAQGRPPAQRAAMVSVGAGLCFANSAVFVKLTTNDLVHRGVTATALDWPGYALAFSALLGLLLEQDAFAAGSLPTAVGAMTITNPVASYLIGVLAFDVRPPTSPASLAAVTGSLVLIAAGVAILARSPTVRLDTVDTAVATEPGEASA